MNNDLNYYIYLKKIRKIFKKKICLFFDHQKCDSEIIRSHTIQKRRALDKIAKDSHVYGYMNSKKFEQFSNPLSIQKISINEASTFYGFCKKHDNELFALLDDLDYYPTLKQAYLITYRTLIRELYTKNAAVNSEPIMNEVFAQIPDISDKDIFLDNMKGHQDGTKRGLSYLYYVADKMFNSIIQDNFQNIQYFVIELNRFPEIMSSGAFMPEYDYSKNKIQDLYRDKVTSWLALNIFADSTKGIISFTWLNDKVIEKFLLTLISSNDMTNKIVELAFTYIENTFFSIDWYDKLSITKKSRIEKMVHDFLHYNIETREYTGLRSNNLQYVNWEILKVTTNNDEISKFYT